MYPFIRINHCCNTYATYSRNELFFLRGIKKREPVVGDVFKPYKESNVFWKMVGATIVQGIFILLWSLLLIILVLLKR